MTFTEFEGKKECYRNNRGPSSSAARIPNNENIDDIDYNPINPIINHGNIVDHNLPASLPAVAVCSDEVRQF